MPPHITRHCIDVRGRSVHYLHCGAGPAVLLLHASPRSSAALLPLMQQGPAGLALYAPDTPGFGLSDPLHLPAPDIEDQADALRDTLDALGIAQAALYGSHTGAAIALALAVRHPRRVSQLVLDGVSSFDAAERAMLLPAYLPAFEPRIDGGHMASVWSRVRDQALFFPWHHRGVGARLWRPLPAAQSLHDSALDLLRASGHRRAHFAAYRAALCTDAAAWVARLQVPALIGARPDDVLAPHLQRLGEPPPGVQLARLPQQADACAERLWAALLAGRPASAAPPPRDSGLPPSRVADAFAQTAGAAQHLRGASGGAGRPLVLLHPSPGGPRSLDAQMQRLAGLRPVLAPSLPGHGESAATAHIDDASLLDAVEHGLLAAGIAEADIEGSGAGSALAPALAARRPALWQCRVEPTRRTAAQPPGPFTPRDDGGHLFAAWQHARDDSVLGPWWDRRERHACGDAIDVQAVHRHAVEVLKEAPAAAAWRAGPSFLAASGDDDAE